MNALDRLSIAQKFSLVFAMTVLPIAFLLWLYASERLQTVAFAETELGGLEHLQAMPRIATKLSRHLALSNAKLNGGKDLDERLAEAANTLSLAVAAVDSTRLDPASVRTWEEVATGWEQLVANPPSSANVVSAHSALLTKLLAHIRQVSAASNLRLDPGSDSYGVISYLTEQLPKTMNASAVMWGEASGIVARTVMTEEEQAGLLAQLGELDAILLDSRSQIKAVGAENSAIKATLGKPLQSFDTAIDKFRGMVESDVVNAWLVEISVDQLFAVGDAALKASADAWEQAYPGLRAMLEARKDAVYQSVLSTLGIVFATVLVIFVFVFWILRRIRAGTRSAVKHLGRIEAGELSFNIQIRGNDEIAQLHQALLTMQQQLRTRVEAEQAVASEQRRIIDDTVRVLGAVARGDLTEKIEADYEGPFAQLKADANETVSKLISVMGEIKVTAEQVATGASGIAQGNANISLHTEQQASSLEQTASSMEQMTATVRQNADNAQEADSLAAGALAQAETGGEIVGRAVESMGGINEASTRIADIIGVIDEIAFQTNLLALNASVEAARAGEQGRGFAVVASEVRNLAGRSAAAAKEIKALIENSVDRVKEGTKLVDESGNALEEIRESVRKVSDIVAEIAGASREQSAGIEQVNQAVSQMDRMTQQNASLVERAAVASESMGAQASRMRALVAFFDTGGESDSLSTYTGPERRSAARPWSGPAKGASAPSSGIPPVSSEDDVAIVLLQDPTLDEPSMTDMFPEDEGGWEGGPAAGRATPRRVDDIPVQKTRTANAAPPERASWPSSAESGRAWPRDDDQDWDEF